MDATMCRYCNGTHRAGSEPCVQCEPEAPSESAYWPVRALLATTIWEARTMRPSWREWLKTHGDFLASVALVIFAAVVLGLLLP